MEADVKQGGGSTFGVITSVTIRAFPSTDFHVATVILGTGPGTEGYWDVVANVLSQYPTLDEQGISGYAYLAPGILSPDLNITSPIDAFFGVFFLPQLHPTNTSTSLEETIKKLFADVSTPYPGQYFSSVSVKSYPDFWTWYAVNNGPLEAGGNTVLGSRLIDGEALTKNLTALKQAYEAATPPGHMTSVFLVGGKGVRDAKPRGGSNSVGPAWRKAYIHSGMYSKS